MSRETIERRLELVDETPTIFDPIDVLDKGFVRLVDWMGDDSSIVHAARVSYQAGTKVKRSDAGLIDYLVRKQHTSPIEQVQLTFHIKMPLFVFGQLVRHRTASLNAQSARYSVMKDEFYIPDRARKQSEVNRQGSVMTDDRALTHRMRAIMEEITRISYSAYESLLEAGVAREMSRIILPQNLYTEFYWTQDLHNLLHLLKLRLDGHAQWEIQQYAQAMFELTHKVAPLTVEAWERHRKESLTLSSYEVDMLREVLTSEVLEQLSTTLDDRSDLSAGVRREALEKFTRLVR